MYLFKFNKTNSQDNFKRVKILQCLKQVTDGLGQSIFFPLPNRLITISYNM